MSMTLFRLAITMDSLERRCENASPKTVLPNNSASSEAQEVLKVDVSVQAQAGLDLGDDVRSALEGVVDIMSGLKMAGVVGELAAAELGDLLDLGAFGFEFFGDGGDEFVNGAVEGFGVKDDQALVFATHRCEIEVIECVCDSGSPRWRCLGNAQAAQLPEPWQACFREATVRRVKIFPERGRPCCRAGFRRCRF